MRTVGTPTAPRALAPTAATTTTIALRSFGATETAGRRDEEAFLSQYDPLEVLGLHPETDDMIKVHDAYGKLDQAFGPSSGRPNLARFKNVQKAYDILKDHQSVYYKKARPTQTNRRKLMLQVVPAKQKQLIFAQSYTVLIFVLMGIWGIAYSIFFPMIKITRAASRGS